MAKAELKWINPTTRVTALAAPAVALDPSEISEVDVLDGSTIIGTVAGRAGTTFVTGDLSPGVHSFSVVVKDQFGQMSAPSDVATLTVTAPLPAPPSPATGLTATLIP